MQETKRIAGLFSDLYNGNPWIDVNIMDTLGSLNAQQASVKQGEGWNSIWQIINHLVSWREHLLENLGGGNLVSPADNYFRPVEDTSAEAWQTTLKRLASTQRQWENFLQQLQDPALEEKMPGHKFTNYEYLHGLLQHDTYHLGQIAMLAKHAKG